MYNASDQYTHAQCKTKGNILLILGIVLDLHSYYIHKANSYNFNVLKYYRLLLTKV